MGCTLPSVCQTALSLSDRPKPRGPSVTHAKYETLRKARATRGAGGQGFRNEDCYTVECSAQQHNVARFESTRMFLIRDLQ